jgi:hypothetical protein
MRPFLKLSYYLLAWCESCFPQFSPHDFETSKMKTFGVGTVRVV